GPSRSDGRVRQDHRAGSRAAAASALTPILRLFEVHHRWEWGVQPFGMSQRVRVRRLSDDEGRMLQRIVRRGGGKSQVSVVRYRRAMVVLASAGGNTGEGVARPV